MQFQVPQFIEVEDKIFGPFTFKQFVYMAGGAGLSYLLWRVFPVLISAPLIIAVGAFTVALAFMQYNGRPFMIALETAFHYVLHSKLYLWNNRTKKRIEQAKEAPITVQAPLYVPKISDSRLHELAWSLDIKERIAAGVGSQDDRLATRGSVGLTSVHTSREALRELTQQ